MIVKLKTIKRESGNVDSDEMKIGTQFKLHEVTVGRGANLQYFGEKDKIMITPQVENVSIFDRLIKIQTNNTEYLFEMIM